MFPLRDPQADALGSAAGRRDRNRLETRHRLNAAALRLFAERGYEATGIDDIVVAAGVSVRTFFRYYASKEDVLFAQEMDIDDFLGRLAGQPPDVPPVEAIRRAYREQRAATPEEVELNVLFHRAMTSSATLQGRYFEGLHAFREELARVLAGRGHRRTPAEADVLAATIGQTVLDHAVTRWIARGARGDLRRAVDAAFRLLDRITTPRTR